jgi:hypothetical protein
MPGCWLPANNRPSRHDLSLMYPEDRVLVGVINRKRDFEVARREHWYRIPRDRAPRTIDTEYVAFYLSGYFKDQNGGIRYFARRTGHELVRRRDLLPNEANHKHANHLYYKIQFGDLQEKIPPILNPTHRPISFLYTTWDRFINARTIADLYSKADWFVERVYRSLRAVGITPDRRWEDENPSERIAELRIACQHGIVTASTGEAAEGAVSLLPGDSDGDVNASVAAIQAAVAALGGPMLVDIPPGE